MILDADATCPCCLKNVAGVEATCLFGCGRSIDSDVDSGFCEHCGDYSGNMYECPACGAEIQELTDGNILIRRDGVESWA